MSQTLDHRWERSFRPAFKSIEMYLIASLFDDSNLLFTPPESMRFMKLHRRLVLAVFFFFLLKNVITGVWQPRLTNR